MRFILISTRRGSISIVLFIIDPLRLKTGKLKHPRGFLNPRRDSLRTVLFNYRVTGKLADSGKPGRLPRVPLYRKMPGERHTLCRCAYPSRQFSNSFFPPTILFFLGKRCRFAPLPPSPPHGSFAGLKLHYTLVEKLVTLFMSASGLQRISRSS